MAYSAYGGVPHACARCGNGTLRIIDGAFEQARRATRDLAPGDHAILAYDDADEVAGFCSRFLEEGVGLGDHVVAALPGDLGDKVRSLLSDDVAAGVDWQETSTIYGEYDAARIAGLYDEIIEGDDRVARILSGPDRSDTMTLEELDRCERLAHEIVIDRGAIAVCLFDSGLMPPEFIDLATRRHTLAVAEGEVRRNEQFEYAPA